jgi:DNA replication protein DnaC
MAPLTTADDDHRFEARWKLYTVPKLLMIDEIGDIPIDRHGAHRFFQLISRR